MSRGLEVWSRRQRLAAGSIFVALMALGAAVIWWAEAHRVAFQYALGVGLVVLGVVFTTLRLTLSNDFVRRHFGESGAAPARRAWRSGWTGILLMLCGLVMLGLLYLDHWVEAAAAESRFNAAFNRGLSAAKTRDWATAADAFSEAIRLDPSRAKSYRHRGAAYLHRGEYDRAVTDFDEALRLAPDDAHIVYNRGVAYFQKEDYDRALADFGEAIRLNPGYAKAYLARGSVYARKGDDARAAADRQKAAELDPSLETSSGPSL